MDKSEASFTNPLFLEQRHSNRLASTQQDLEALVATQRDTRKNDFACSEPLQLPASYASSGSSP
jgi:hypothetical protein